MVTILSLSYQYLWFQVSPVGTGIKSQWVEACLYSYLGVQLPLNSIGFKVVMYSIAQQGPRLSEFAICVTRHSFMLNNKKQNTLVWKMEADHVVTVLATLLPTAS